MAYKKLLSTLNSFKATDKSCSKIYCSTCGGAVSTIQKSNITAEINEMLLDLTVPDFLNLNGWREFLLRNYLARCHLIFEREFKQIDISDIKQLDYYLFHARSVMKNTTFYENLLNKSIHLAIETSNESLIETVLIILGEQALNYDSLLQLSLEKSKTSKNIHRVLYNNLREELPQVRDYVGDGTSILAW